MSKIEPLPNISWSPKAALIDLMDEIDEVENVFILCTMKDGTKNYRTANLTNAQTLWILQNHIYRMMRDNNE